MILYARVENYRSIGEKQTLSFVANTDKSHNDFLIEEENLKVLPVIPIYGGNATGKTNILKFLKMLVEIVTGKIDIEKAYEPCKFYQEKKETIFEVVFIEDQVKYYYKISYTNIEILEEGLFYYPNGKISKIFHKLNKEFSFGPTFESYLSKYSENLSEKACFLNTISKFLGDATKSLNDVNKFFKENFIFINFDTTTYNIENAKEIFKKNPENNKKLKEFINYFYTHMNIGAKGIIYSSNFKPGQDNILKKIFDNKDFLQKLSKKQDEKLKVELEFNEEELIKMLLTDNDKMYLVYETKNGDIEIPIEEESEGIKKIFSLGLPIAEALCQNKIIVFDELEVGFHPILSRKIVELFLGPKNKAQLLFTTHNTNLLNLELFRRDQIYFASRTEKTDFKTVIKSLGEIPGIRKSADIEKAYLEGKYSDAPTYEKFNKEDIGDILCQV
ncbi:AAA family ATPase [Cetobacterium sp. SF1]|uniref:AAA family ATPase n=1 Tax=Cetobacterium sp. SF1 TaxID=3417654 RepID=UPI003CF222CF